MRNKTTPFDARSTISIDKETNVNSISHGSQCNVVVDPPWLLDFATVFCITWDHTWALPGEKYIYLCSLLESTVCLGILKE